MSAPAALAMSKLSYPETEVSKATSKDFQNLRQAYVYHYMLSLVEEIACVRACVCVCCGRVGVGRGASFSFRNKIIFFLILLSGNKGCNDGHGHDSITENYKHTCTCK